MRVPALTCAFPRGWTMYVLREEFCPSVTSSRGTKPRIHPQTSMERTRPVSGQD